MRHLSNLVWVFDRSLAGRLSFAALDCVRLNNRRAICLGLPRSLAALAMVVQANVADYTAERVSVDSQRLCGFRLIAIIPCQRILDKPPLKFGDCVFKVDPMLNHLVNQGVELILHSRTPTSKIP
jgi:hypothetical protein